MDIKFFSPFQLGKSESSNPCRVDSKSQPRNPKLLHVLIFQGARPRIIRITRSCRTESRIGCIGIEANPTCWRLTIGGVAMISDEQDRADGDPDQVGHVHRPVRARQGASRIRHLRLAVTRGFRPISLVPPDNFANGRSTPILAFSSVRGLYFAPFSWTTYLKAMHGNPARISFNPLLAQLSASDFNDRYVGQAIYTYRNNKNKLFL